MTQVNKLVLCTLLVMAPIQQASAVVWFAPLFLLGKGTVVAKGSAVVAAKVATGSKVTVLAKASVAKTAIVKTTVVKTHMTKAGVAIGGATSAKSAVAVQSGQQGSSVSASAGTSLGKSLSRQMSKAQEKEHLRELRKTVVGEIFDNGAPKLINSMSGEGSGNKKKQK